MKNAGLTIVLVLSLGFSSSCAMVRSDSVTLDGAKAGAFCATGGPGGVAGALGASGIVAGLKAAHEFIGVITVQPDCSMQIISGASQAVVPTVKGSPAPTF